MKHRNTLIYQRAIELCQLSKQLLDGLPRGYGYAADQLRRACSSVLLNFAEGCGKRTPASRRSHFVTAKGSAYEVAAVFDLAAHLGIISAERNRHAQDVADHVAAMLSRYR